MECKFFKEVHGCTDLMTRCFEREEIDREMVPELVKQLGEREKVGNN